MIHLGEIVIHKSSKKRTGTYITKRYVRVDLGEHIVKEYILRGFGNSKIELMQQLTTKRVVKRMNVVGENKGA